MTNRFSTVSMAVLALFVGSSAYAADINSTKDSPSIFSDAPKAFSWTGFYIGAHGGWADGDWDGTLAYTDPKTGKTDDGGFSDPTQSVGGEGWVGGLQVGFNRQIRTLVLGIEADASYSDFEGEGTFSTDKYKNGFVKKHSLDMDYFGTVRGRAGVAMGRFLPYITGGLAWAKTEADLEVSYPKVPGYGPADKTSNASADETHLGWVAGAGIETIVGNGWTFRVEYLHYDLGEEDYAFKGKVYNGDAFETDSFRSDLKFDVVRAGLNYKFGGSPISLD